MKKQNFNTGWSFYQGSGSALSGLMGGATAGRQIMVPHDASIETARNAGEPGGSGNGYFHEEDCHYIKEFDIDAADTGKNVWLEFEGVYQNSYVYINGSFAGQHPYGYSNYYIDVTRFIRFGEKNTVKVIVKNGVPSGRWYTGGGIYRNVNLMIADRLHLIPDGVHLAAMDVEDALAVIRIESVLEYQGMGNRKIDLVSQLIDAAGNVAAEDHMPIFVEEGTRQPYRQKLYVKNPMLWDDENPYLYTYKVRVMEDDAVIDEESGYFGIRKLQLDPVNGLRVNGKVIKLRGGCIHHDNGILGAAEFPHAAEYRVKALKKAGYNAIRSAHYPMSRLLLDACDKYGMYVMDEFADVWTTTKADYDYGMVMAKWWESDVTNLVNKDYNHPCVIFYSIGNEIPETGNAFDVQWGKKLADKIRSLDDSRYVTNSLNLMLAVMDRMGEVMGELASKAGISMEGIEPGQEINNLMSKLGDVFGMAACTDIASKATEEAASQVDAIGYNYASDRYIQDGDKYPNRIIIGSETNPKDLDVNWELVEKLPYVIGDFDWTAWDYLGEAGIGKISYGDNAARFYAEYPYKAAYCGDINLIGDRRPTSYWREIIWGLRTKPYLCAQPPKYYGAARQMTQWSMTDAVRSWNWNGYEGKPIMVEVYTEAEEAALYINDKLVEKKKVGEKKKYQVVFDTVYQPGKVEAVVYKHGEETGRDKLETACGTRYLSVTADQTTLPADGSDIIYINLALCDEAGRIFKDIDQTVNIYIEGPGIIQGFGSANPESEENYFDTAAKTYEGRLRAAIRGNGQKGMIKVRFEAQGLQNAEIEITSE